MVEGVEALRRRLVQQVPQSIAQRVTDAMERAAEQIVSDMKRVAPVLSEPDPKRRPGALRDSIGWTWGAAPKGSFTIASASGGGEYQTLRITIYAGNAEAFYARFVEFGTRKMRARPFFFGVYRTNKKRIRANIQRALNKAIKDNLK